MPSYGAGWPTAAQSRALDHACTSWGHPTHLLFIPPLVEAHINECLPAGLRINCTDAVHFGGNNRGRGVGQSPIPTQPTHLVEGEKSDIGDVFDGGHFGVGGNEAQAVPPLRGNGMPLKGERRVIPLWITGREIIIQGQSCPWGGRRGGGGGSGRG